MIPIILLVIFLTLLGLTVYLKTNSQTLKYLPETDPTPNPLMGWAPWATIKKSEQPHSLVYADLTWREFEPQEGEFDFSTFETCNQFQHWSSEGKRVVFRFVLDKPEHEEHIDIPDWLIEKINADGDFYDNDYGKGFSPNYANPILINYHEKAIQALGQKYGQDDFFAYIELGSLGHWGEWHINYGSGIKTMPLEAVRNIYVGHYVEAFPNTHLLMRRPFSIVAQLNLGLFNDMTGDLIATDSWLNWIENGGNYSQTKEINAYKPMLEIWKTAPIGGEQAGSMSDDKIYDQNLDQTIQLLKESHTTFIGPGSPYKQKAGGPLQDGINQVLSTIGYRLYVDQISMTRWVYFSNKVTIQFDLGNAGIAPMYYNWPVRFYLLNNDGMVVLNIPADLDLRKILPGEIKTYKITIPLDNIENGVYSIGFAILDPNTNQPAVKIAMENSREDLIQELGQIEVKRIKIIK